MTRPSALTARNNLHPGYEARREDRGTGNNLIRERRIMNYPPRVLARR
jgi:hypothetical protein